MMSKKLLSYAGLTTLFLILAFAFDRWSSPARSLSEYASEVESYLRKEEKKAKSLLGERADFLQTQLAGPIADAEEASENAAQLQKYSQEDYTLCIYRGDSLLFWSNNKALPSAELLKQWQKEPFEPKIHELQVGKFEVFRQPFGSRDMAYVLIPVKYSLHSSNESVHHRAFPANKRMPDGIEVSEAATDFPIRAEDGRALGFLSAGPEVHFLETLQIRLLLYVAALFSFFLCVNVVSRRLAQKYQVWLGAVLLLLCGGGVMWANHVTHFTRQFSDMTIFTPTATPFLANSIGDMLLNIAILLWLMIFFHREFTDKGYEKLALPVRFGISVGQYLNVVMSVMVSTWIFRVLVYNSSIHFDFGNIFNLNLLSIMAIVGVILLLGAMFLFSHRMIDTVSRLQLSRWQRAGAGCLAVAIVSPVMLQFRHQLQVDAWQLIAFALAYTMMFDFFVDQSKRKLPWIVTWLIVFSWFSTILLFKYNDLKDKEQRLAIARELAESSDSLAEDELKHFRNELLGAPELNQKIAPPAFFRTGADSLRGFLNARFFKNSYLFQHYQYDLAVFDQKGQNALIPENEKMPRPALEKWWAESKPSMGAGDFLKHWSNQNDSSFYLLKIPASAQGDSTQKVEIWLLVSRAKRAATNVFTHLFFSKPYKNLGQLTRYDYAIFRNDRLRETNGKVNESLYDKTRHPAPGDFFNFESSRLKREDLVYRSEDGKTIVILGREASSWIKMLYLFSYIFTALSFFMLILALFNSFFNVLPEYYNFYLTTKGMLSRRIQTWMGGVIVASFLIIGGITLDNFNTSSERNIRESLNTRTASLLSQIEGKVEGWIAEGSLQKNIQTLAEHFSTDVNYYSPSGDLMFTSQPELFEIGAISSKMGANSWHELSKRKLVEHIELEKTGAFEYNTAYIALRGEDLTKTLGYVGLPYYLKESGVRPDISDFIGKMLSLYVCLLLAAGFIAMWVADSISTPIKRLGDDMREVRLEQKNEPLQENDGNDELTDLIREYNKMLAKLEESKNALARSEREGAWRDMARMTAHEIKNPLTTMKLSIQLLGRVSQTSTPVDLEAKLKRTIAQLVEQIDNLSQIANEFSTFAKLGEPGRNDIVLNDVVQSVFDLFINHENVRFSIKQPENGQKLHVLGDTSNMMRVFNNLIINALQAIPSTRNGQIDVEISKKGDRALVRVSDNAGGVPDEIRDRIFDPNFTTKTSGSGLGLAICKRIVDALGGSMYFEVREDDGTDFFVEMPLQRVEEPRAEATFAA